MKRYKPIMRRQDDKELGEEGSSKKREFHNS
jgi:hypothetical protein